MLRFNVKEDIREIKADIKLMDSRVKKQAARTALNKAANAVIRVSAREAALALEISPQRNIKNRLRLNKATLQRLTAEVVTLTLPLKVSKVGKQFKKTTTGASIKRYNFPGAFVATMKSGHKAIWKRKEGSVTSTGREKIEEATIEIEEELNKIVDAQVEQKAGPKIFLAEFDKELRRLMAFNKIRGTGRTRRR